MSRVAVTGSAGFLGRAVVAALRARGHEPVLLKRDAASRDRWAAACADVDAVIHLAAPVSDVDEKAVLEAVEVTRSLLDALPPRALRVVHAGTIASYRVPTGAHLSEADPTFDDRDVAQEHAYTRMKHAQEALLRDRCAARGDSLAVLRPSTVWGADRWFQSCVGPRIGPVWVVVRPRRTLRLVHVDNAARAFVDAIDDRTTAFDVFNVDDAASVTAWDYARRHGHGLVPVPLPGGLFDALLALGGRVWRIVRPGRHLPGLFLPDRRRSRFGAYGINSSRVRARFAWTPDLQHYR